ncbi:hypothetical protein RZS08_36185, partial [Arthrospira platensis SPKY1]|nr:hypothetical protein [Arthrospira platensis SPKY1]
MKIGGTGGTGGSTGTGGTGGAVKTPVPVESSDKLAKIRKVTLVSTEPYTATIRVEGTYTCDKVRYSTDVIGKTIYIKIHDTKNRGNDCTGGGTYTRTFTFKPLVPG